MDVSCTLSIRIISAINFNPLFITARNSLLRKAAPDMLCAFLCSAKGSEFVTIRVVNDGTTILLQQINFIPSPEFDLIEFDVNYKRIWGLWCNSQGEYNVSSYSLVSNGGYNWSSAGLEILPERKIESGSDPRQAYCSYIFYPGRFQREVIDRALIVSVTTNDFDHYFHSKKKIKLNSHNFLFYRCSVALMYSLIQMFHLQH